MISHEEIKRVLSYNPDTGVFTWLVKARKGKQKAGDVAGRYSNGYRIIKFRQVDYQAHRLAWFYMTGAWPKDQIDHIDRDRSNNRFANLREATNKQNHENCGKPSHNTSGAVGVSWEAKSGKWYAYITSNLRMKSLGRYPKFEDALAARAAAEAEMFTHAPKRVSQ